MRIKLPVGAIAEQFDTNVTALPWNPVYAIVVNVRDGLVVLFWRSQDFLYPGFDIPKVAPSLISHLR
jgi:hypothetical protein